MNKAPNLEELLEQAKAKVRAMSPKEIEDMLAEQARSWVRGEMAREETSRLARTTASDPTGDKLRAKIVACGSPDETTTTTYIALIHSEVADIHKDNSGLGFYMHFAGSHESLFVGNAKPDCEVGQRVVITVQKQEDFRG